MIGIIDYGVGNLFSLQASCKAVGQDVFVSGDGAELQKADRLILPGVGAFPDAAKKLNDTGMADFVREQAAKGTPFWVFAWECSCCLRKVWNTAAIRGWVC